MTCVRASEMFKKLGVSDAMRVLKFRSFDKDQYNYCNQHNVAIAVDLWELSGPNIEVLNYMIAFAFAVQAVVVALNYELSFITSVIAKHSKTMADSIHYK